MYLGEYTVALDDKWRITVPQAFRLLMEANDHDIWFMTRGYDSQIFLYHKARWDQLLKDGEKFFSLDPLELDFSRMFLAGSQKVKVDNAYRLNIPGPLREFAGIEKEAVLLGVNDHLELWSRDTWRAFQGAQMQQYKKMAARFFGRNGHASTEGEPDHDEH